MNRRPTGTALNRRSFVAASAATVVASQIASRNARAAESPNERIVLGIMGLNGRGTDLARSFVALPGVSIAHLCDVDERAIGKARSAIGSASGEPKSQSDFRRILDDPAVDALVIAAPDHWHGPATISACAANKHVYVEKPASHNPREGELMVAAARRHKRVVQLGTQRRSMPDHIEAIRRLQAGEIGRVLLARAWYAGSRKSIGRGNPAEPPSWLNYVLWQGPAPKRPYRDNVVHYNWHWFWHWGTGELGNNGVHALDLCRWGLGVDYPRQVSAGGGKYRYDDDQETPDTHLATFDFGTASIVWEGRSWQRRGIEGSSFGAAFECEQGNLIMDEDGCRFTDPDGKAFAPIEGRTGQDAHLSDFLAAIRDGRRPNAEIEEGHKTTLLCHLGNIAYRVGRTLHLDAQTGAIRNDAAAAEYWSREYEPGWEPRV